MRRSIFLLLVLLLPYSMVAVAQDMTPTPEGFGEQPGGSEVQPGGDAPTPESAMDVGGQPGDFELTATAIIVQATAAVEGSQGGGQVDAQDGGQVISPTLPVAQVTQPAPAAAPAEGQGGGFSQEGYGVGGYYDPAAYPGYIQHRVSYGENLFRISLRYGVPIYAIQAANPIIRNVNLIYAGTILLIPTGQGQPGYPPVEPPYYPPHGCVQIPKGPCLTPTVDPQYPTPVPTYQQPTGCIQIPKGPCLTPTVPGGITVTAPPPVNTNFELGGHVFGYANAADMRNALMTWSKVQIRWEQGQDTSSAQAAIDEARAQDFNILLSIVGVPQEIQANPTQYYQSFAAYLGDVAALGPDAIEVWNEQNIDREWPNGLISPAAYTEMLSAAYQSIKAANSDVLVISGAPAPTGFFGGACTGTGCDDAPFIQGMAANGAANFADCIGVHYNEGILPPTATTGDPRQNGSHYTRYYPAMVNLYSSTFPNTPLCFTELGYLSPEGYPPLPVDFDWAQNTSVQEQSDWLAQAVSLSRQSNRIRLLIVWNVNATEYGSDPQAGFAIVRPGNTCPACVALNGVMQ